jgi:hypothetical protein
VTLWRCCALAVLLLLLPACRDIGQRRYDAAEARYRALVLEGVSPRDPRFEAVREDLRAVSEGSRAHARAQDLLRRLEAVQNLPERPLAVPGHGGPDGGCEPLARALGEARGEARAQLMRELSACRVAEEKRRAHEHAE